MSVADGPFGLFGRQASPEAADQVDDVRAIGFASRHLYMMTHLDMISYPRDAATVQTTADIVELLTRGSGAVLAVAVALPTVASLARRIVPMWRRCSWLDVATLPAVRRSLDRLLGFSLTVGVVATPLAQPALASAAPPSAAQTTGAQTAVANDGPPYVRGTFTGTGSDPASPPTLSPTTPSTPGPTATAGPNSTSAWAPGFTAPPAEVRRTHVVTRGEHLWSIARGELIRHALPHDQRSTARYWARLVRTNRARLRSGNPSLVFAGEVLELPPLPGTPTDGP